MHVRGFDRCWCCPLSCGGWGGCRGRRSEQNNGIPADLLDDPHVREELAVNEFTAPSISKLFDTLQFLMPLPLLETELKMPERMPLDRADLAIELGFLIADGFLVVQAEQLDKVEDLARS